MLTSFKNWLLFVSPYHIVSDINPASFQLECPEWKIHDVLHVSWLKATVGFTRGTAFV